MRAQKSRAHEIQITHRKSKINRLSAASVQLPRKLSKFQSGREILEPFPFGCKRPLHSGSGAGFGFDATRLGGSNSTTDEAHRARGRDESWIVDVMARLFLNYDALDVVDDLRS